MKNITLALESPRHPKVGRPRGLASLLLLALALPAAAATRYVATTGDDAAGEGTAEKPWRTINYAITNAVTVAGDEILVAGGLYEESVVNNVSSGGKPRLTFKGGYTSAWARDLRNCPSIVKPPANTAPCWHIANSVSNHVSGFVLTGGSHGMIARGSSASNADASYRNRSTISKFYTVLSQLIVTNNVGSGIVLSDAALSNYVTGDPCVIASCLVRDNGAYGIVGKFDSIVYHRILNCTVCNNKKYGFVVGYANNRIVAENSIFYGNKTWDFNAENGYPMAALRRCFVGALNTAQNYSATEGLASPKLINVPLAGVFRMDPGVAADGSLAADSRGVKAGVDLREHPWVKNQDFILEDVYGTLWNGEYDVGAVKSTGANQCGFAASQDVYVATDGDDAAAGTASAPVATIEEGVYRTAANGTCHVGAGTWTSRASLFLSGQKLVGAGMGKTIVSRYANSEPALVVGESFTRVSGITFQDVPTAIRLDPYLAATTNVTIDHCAFRHCTNGVYRQDGYQSDYKNDNNERSYLIPALVKCHARAVNLKNCLFMDCIKGLRFHANNSVTYGVENCDFAYCGHGIYDGKYFDYPANGVCSPIVHSTFVSNRVWAIEYAIGHYPGSTRHYNCAFKGEKGIYFQYQFDPIVLYYCLFDCAQNTRCDRMDKNYRKYDDTNTSFSASADIVVDGTLPGAPNLGSALARVGGSLADVLGADLATDFDDAERDPDGIDVGAFISPETKAILNPAKTYYVKISGTPTTYGDPEPAYGTQTVEEGLRTFSITNGCVRYEDGATALDGGEGLRDKVLGYTYTPEGGTSVARSDAYFTYDVQTNAECLWRWEHQCKVVVDAGRHGSTVSVNGGAYAPAVTNWYPVGGSLAVNFKLDDAAETFVGWRDSDGGSPASATQFVYTAGKPITLTVKCRVNHFVCTTGSDETGDGTRANPWRTIHHAIESDATSENDIIFVGGGLYEESVTNNVSKGGKHLLSFIGGYRSDWKTRDLRNNPSIVKPPVKTVPCWFIENSASNHVSGFVLTGGKYGINPTGRAGMATGDNPCNFPTILTQLIVTNNVKNGIHLGKDDDGNYATGDPCVIASCLVMHNGGMGIAGRQDTRATQRILNCTVCSNKYGYATYYANNHCVAENSIFSGNTSWDVQAGHAAASETMTVLRRCFVGSFDTGYKYSASDGFPYGKINEPLEGVFRMDPGLAAGGSLADDSRCVKAGYDLRGHPWIGGEDFILEDVYGTPWNGEYDIGAVKTTGANRRGFAASQDVYVATDGDDAAAGTASAPVATVEEGLYRTAANGTCHLGAGTWTSRASLFLPGQRLVGAGIDRTILRQVKDSEPALIVGESFTRVSGITFRDAPTAIRLEPLLSATTNVTIDHCAFRHCTNGIYRQDGRLNSESERNARLTNPFIFGRYGLGLTLSECVFTDCRRGHWYRCNCTSVDRVANCVFAYNDYGLYDGKFISYDGKTMRTQPVVHTTFVSNRNWAANYTVGNYPGNVRYYNCAFKDTRGLYVHAFDAITLYHCCFDCAENTRWGRLDASYRKYDNTNTSFSAAIDVAVGGAIPGAPRARSALARVGGSIASVWGEDLALDVIDKKRDPEGIDVGAYRTPETRHALAPGLSVILR